ncbi:hypothetical protein HYPSUDRAFT_483210, partial [Hypholoma sublateritium FD-334 SS-4]
MAESAKRLLTDDIHDARVRADQWAAASDTPDELTQRLRNAGSRVRKSVMEGYRTTPSSFSKAQSTGSIFRSMNDTLRDVYANSSGEISNAMTRKRARSASVGEPEAITEESEISADALPSQSATSSPLEEGISNRKIKSLRASSRSYLQTRSLPTGAFAFAGASITQPSLLAMAEDDWSQESCFEPTQLSFEPMAFD